jgi:hypothetical protein
VKAIKRMMRLVVAGIVLAAAMTWAAPNPDAHAAGTNIGITFGPVPSVPPTPGGILTLSLIVTASGTDALKDSYNVALFSTGLDTATWTCNPLDVGVGCHDIPINLPVFADSFFLEPIDHRGRPIVQYEISMLVPQDATEMTIVATVDVLRDDIPTDDIAQITIPVYRPADISVTVNDGTETYVSGAPLTYDVTVHNDGPNPATGLDIAGSAPADAVWTCTPGSGATCAPSGSGGFSDVVDLAVGATATYTVSFSTPPTPQGAFEFAVAVPTLGRDSIDLDPTDNTAADLNFTPASSGTADIALTITNERDFVDADQPVTHLRRGRDDRSWLS